MRTFFGDIYESAPAYGNWHAAEGPIHDIKPDTRPLIAVCYFGLCGAFLSCWELGPEHFQQQNSRGETLLIIATDRNYCCMVQLLLEKGAPIDGCNDSKDRTALHCASSQGSLRIVELLLRKGANVNCLCSAGTALTLACETGCLKVVKLLLSKGVETNIRSRCDGYTVFYHALSHGNVAIIELLLLHEAEVNAQCLDSTALIKSCKGWTYQHRRAAAAARSRC